MTLNAHRLLKQGLYIALLFMLLIASSFHSSIARASTLQSVVIDQRLEINLGTSVSYIQDPQSEITSEYIAEHVTRYDWQVTAGETPNLGFDATPTWFAVNLQPDETMERMLEVSYPVLNYLDVFLFEDGVKVKSYKTGSALPFDSRPVPNRNFLFPMLFEKDKDYLLLVRVETGGAIQLPIILWEEHKFSAENERDFAMLMLFAGIMLALAIYNFLIFLSIKEMPYLWYVISVVALAMSQLSIRGILFQYLWPNYPVVNQFALTVAVTTCMASISFFSVQFLGIKGERPILSRWVSYFGWIGVGLLIFALFVPYSVTIRPIAVMAVIASLLILALGVYLIKKGHVLARYYILAFSFSLIGTTVFALNKLGVLPYVFLSEYAMIIGSSIQVLLLSLAMAYRIHLERRHRIKAQYEALNIQQKANEELEHKVHERTEQLQQAYEEMKRLSEIDGLTKIRNRQSFDSELNKEWRRSSRTVDELSVVMMDADNFKRINDTWGHPCGDACLQHIATICRTSLNRAADVVARYGGEEFILLLPSTHQEGAEAVAETIRQAIEKSPVKWQEQEIDITVSIGVATMTPNSRLNYEDLVHNADKALYAAKQQGRNRVVVYDETVDLELK